MYKWSRLILVEICINPLLYRSLHSFNAGRLMTTAHNNWGHPSRLEIFPNKFGVAFPTLKNIKNKKDLKWMKRYTWSETIYCGKDFERRKICLIASSPLWESLFSRGIANSLFVNVLIPHRIWATPKLSSESSVIWKLSISKILLAWVGKLKPWYLFPGDLCSFCSE